ncbi:MAG: response regulator [Deltaproteobacteria bacterium]|nr:response regulator [Deltaproteobacteria bacterium]
MPWRDKVDSFSPMGTSGAVFRRVLCVDDSKHIRGVIEKLMPDGFEFYGAADGVEALEYIASCKFDLIILDIDMPRLNGIELLRAARSREVETPVILYTGESRSRKIKEFMKLGIDDFILKPCAADFLREKIIFVATQRAIQVDEAPPPEVLPAPTQIVPPQVLGGDTPDGPPVSAPPPVLAAPAVVADAGPGFSALFVVQQVRYPSRIFDVSKPSIVMGRGASVDLKLPHQSVSRQHAKLEYKKGDFVLTDLGSANGTLIKEKPIKEYKLQPNDVIHIGDFFLVFKTEQTKGSLSWMENYDVSDKEAEQVEGGTRMLSPEALQDAMQHVSLRNSTVLIRGDDESCSYALGEMLYTFGAGGIPCEGFQGPADVHIFWDGGAHRVKRVSGQSEVVWVNGEMAREKVLELGDEIRVGTTSFFYKISG